MSFTFRIADFIKDQLVLSVWGSINKGSEVLTSHCELWVMRVISAKCSVKKEEA